MPGQRARQHTGRCQRNLNGVQNRVGYVTVFAKARRLD